MFLCKSGFENKNSNILEQLTKRKLAYLVHRPLLKTTQTRPTSLSRKKTWPVRSILSSVLDDKFVSLNGKFSKCFVLEMRVTI